MSTSSILEIEVEAVLRWFADNRGIDLRDYRRETFGRGIATRIQARGCASVLQYLELLEREHAELDGLLSTLTIPVTGFFRDRAVFEAIEKTVVPDLQHVCAAFPPLRVWCAGVATGEEAWSFAMILSARSQATASPFEVLGTDLDGTAIDLARRGRYPASALEGVPRRFAEACFRVEGEQCVVAHDALGGTVHFAPHDLMGRTLTPAHAIVASFHLVSCRNVLIHFDRRLREKALERLLSVVVPGGALVLGPVETIPDSLGHLAAPYPGLDPALRVLRVGARR